MLTEHRRGVVIVRVWTEHEHTLMKVVLDRSDLPVETIGYYASVNEAALAVADALRSLLDDDPAEGGDTDATRR